MTRDQDDSSHLRGLLRNLEGKGYKTYKSIKGRYRFPRYELFVDYVQGDPFAEPSRLRVRVPADVAVLPPHLYESRSRAVALRDQLTRSFDRQARKYSRACGSGKSGVVAIDRPGQQVLERTSVLIDRGEVEARFVVGLPANGRRILGQEAARILCDELPRVVEDALVFANLNRSQIEWAVLTCEDADWIRDRLSERGLVSFVADGATLPRASGIDDRPLKDGALSFQSPPSLRVDFECPNAGTVSGMGVPKGVTLIVGGGFHGKSTLLKAIELGVYNHIPEDGREFVVTDPGAMKIRSEDGRAVTGVAIDLFINNLPFGKDTHFFSTENASGSTSQAAGIVEALESGASTLLIDEDTSATNFMIRDRRMQELIAKDQEPITPYADRVCQLFRDHEVSTILVMGGSGDYFDAADLVIAMENYQPRDVTREALDIAARHQTGRRNESIRDLPAARRRVLAPGVFDASKGRRDRHLKVRRVDEITIGRSEVDMGAVEQLVHESQMRAIAAAMAYAGRKLVDGRRSIPEIVAAIFEEIQHRGLDVLDDEPVGHFAWFRPLELSAAINRLRGLKLCGAN